MLNEGLLSTGAYVDRGEAFRKRNAPLRADFEREFLGTLDKAQALTQVRLKQNPTDQEALYWAGVAHGTRAEFYFALARSYRAAMHEGLQARKYEMQLAHVNPRSADPLLILGIADYAAGSLPWYVKVLLSIAGLHGDRARGIAEMERASQKGHWAREDAKFVLVAVYRREKMYDKALADLQLLAQSYPRNFVVQLETARIHKDRDDWGSAVRVYDALVSKLQSNEAAGSTMPAARILYVAGQAHKHIGEQEKVLRLYEQGGALPGDSIDIYRAELAAASLYQRLGRLAEAERNYQRVASAVPDTEEGRAARRAANGFFEMRHHHSVDLRHSYLPLCRGSGFKGTRSPATCRRTIGRTEDERRLRASITKGSPEVLSPARSFY